MEEAIIPSDDTDRFALAARLVGYGSSFRYRVRGNSLFHGIPLRGAHVLEVGCGTGAWAIWAALHGADRVVGIDPEAQGSSSNVLEKFKESIDLLGLQGKILATDQYLHQLPLQKKPFDLVVMFDVINHLDEEAVTVLHENPIAIERYVTILKMLHSRMRPGGWLVLADSARANFWARLGLPSPFAPTIEWHKHQSPKVWINVLERSGFRHFDLCWSPLQPLPKLTNNWLAQYFASSHFVLRVRVADE